MNQAETLTPVRNERPAVSETYAEARRLSGKVVVGGALRAARTSETFAVENPADLDEIGFAPRCGAEDVAWAVDTAHDAGSRWSKLPARTRGDLLRRVADALEREGEALARLLCLETGNALATQARPEIAAMLEMLRLFAGLALGAQGPDAAVGRRPALLYDARSARRRRRDHSVERAAVPDGGEARTRR